MLSQLYRTLPAKSLSLTITSTAIILLGGSRPFLDPHPQGWWAWSCFAFWAVAWLGMAGLGILQLRALLNRPAMPHDFDPVEIAQQLQAQRQQLQADYTRFQPDYERARQYYLADPANDALLERYQTISDYQTSLRNSMRQLDNLLNYLLPDDY